VAVQGGRVGTPRPGGACHAGEVRYLSNDWAGMAGIIMAGPRGPGWGLAHNTSADCGVGGPGGGGLRETVLRVLCEIGVIGMGSVFCVAEQG